MEHNQNKQPDNCNCNVCIVIRAAELAGKPVQYMHRMHCRTFYEADIAAAEERHRERMWEYRAVMGLIDDGECDD